MGSCLGPGGAGTVLASCQSCLSLFYIDGDGPHLQSVVQGQKERLIEPWGAWSMSIRHGRRDVAQFGEWGGGGVRIGGLTVAVPSGALVWGVAGEIGTRDESAVME